MVRKVSGLHKVRLCYLFYMVRQLLVLGPLPGTSLHCLLLRCCHLNAAALHLTIGQRLVDWRIGWFVGCLAASLADSFFQHTTYLLP